jgi:hypothetical protein
MFLQLMVQQKVLDDILVMSTELCMRGVCSSTGACVQQEEWGMETKQLDSLIALA